MKNTSLATRGSLAEQSKRSKLSFAEAFITVEALVVVDISSSMLTQDVDGEGGKRSRHEEAQHQLRLLQSRFPGKLGVVAFGSHPLFCPSGTLPPASGGTNMLGALQFVSPADGCGIRLIIASDGEPDDAEGTLRHARQMSSTIDTVYIGTSESGRLFMEKLAAATKGRSVAHGVELLADTIGRLLLGDGKS